MTQKMLSIGNSSQSSRKSHHLLLAMGVFFFTVCFLMTAVCVYFGSAIPDLANSGESTALSSTFLDRRGESIWMPLNGREERSTWLSLDSYPRSLLQMIVLSEDKRFFDHHGIDPLATARALVQLLRSGRWVSGASTLDMQLARTVWPELQHSWLKPLQLWQALRLDSHYSKTQLLEQYVNRVPFSYQVTGFGVACEFFYRKNCKELSLAEQAALVVLPRNPTLYSNSPQLLRARGNEVLAKYFETEALEPELKKLVFNEPLNFVLETPRNYAPHFVSQVLMSQKIAPGQKVHTTLDLEIQNFAQSVLLNHFRTRPLLGDSGAALVIERRTGKVRAYVGNFDFTARSAGQLDMIQRLRSPGSTLKPFLYAKALESGYTLSTLLSDMPMVMPTQKGVQLPKNYSGEFTGPKQVRFALANSDNLPALRMATMLGNESVLEVLQRFGFDSLKKEAAHYGAGLVLGNGEVSLWDLAHAYLILANQGVDVPLKLLEHADTETKTNQEQIIDSRITFLINDVLSDPAARAQEFGRNGPLEFNRFVAVKTGTSSDYRDHWTVGFDNDYLVAVWRGNASGQSLGQHIPAARNTGVIFREIMDYLAAHTSAQESVHENAMQNLANHDEIEKVEICSLSGDLATSHCKEHRFEYYLKGQTPRQSCSFHKVFDLSVCGGHGKVAYLDTPEEYKEWAKVQGFPSYHDILTEYCNGRDPAAKTLGQQPYFEEPVEGSLFAIDQGLPADHQKLSILVRGLANASSDYQVYRNGYLIGSPGMDGRIDWQLERGSQRFEIKDHDGQIYQTVNVKIL